MTDASLQGRLLIRHNQTKSATLHVVQLQKEEMKPMKPKRMKHDTHESSATQGTDLILIYTPVLPIAADTCLPN